MTFRDIQITSSGSARPNQIEGTYNGFYFYFRARFYSWSLALHVLPADNASIGDGLCLAYDEVGAGHWTEAETRAKLLVAFERLESIMDSLSRPRRIAK